MLGPLIVVGVFPIDHASNMIIGHAPDRVSKDVIM